MYLLIFKTIFMTIEKPYKMVKVKRLSTVIIFCYKTHTQKKKNNERETEKQTDPANI